MPDRLLPPLTADPPAGVRFDDLGDRLRLTATRDLSGLATGIFAAPAWTVSFSLADIGGVRAPVGDARFAGFSFAQFALPVRGADGTEPDWNPAPNVNSPPVVLPLTIWTGSVAILLAPLDSWHEQAITVGTDDTGATIFGWGWHGDLDAVPEGFTTTLGVYEGPSITGLFERWADDLGRGDAAPAGPEPERWPLLSHLSYWTDNGAAYWYRTEPGLDLGATIEAKLAELDDLGVVIGSVELDSWFYPHETSRPVTEVGYPEDVPPTGMMEWTARPDVLPDGVEGLADRLGRPPLTLHARHITTSSPYVDEDPDGWWVEFVAHPKDPTFFRRWLDDAVRWGATCVEQDWMLLTFWGVQALRAAPGRLVEWQRTLDDEARARDLSLLWCMATPGDYLASAELDQVIALRTCDDYRFAEDPALLWRWYLTVNRLAVALGKPAFKDCFFTMSDPGPTEIDGDPHAEAESLLAALSAGPVGIGDRIGRTDPTIVARLCRPDGVLVKPDRPLALTDRSWFATAADPEPTFAETASGPWRYVVALHAADTADPVTGSLPLGEEMLVYDWRREVASIADEVAVSLDRREWSLFVCCPLGAGADGRRRATIGDPSRYATMGRTRVRVTGDGAAELIVAPGEAPAPVRSWIEGEGLIDRT